MKESIFTVCVICINMENQSRHRCFVLSGYLNCIFSWLYYYYSYLGYCPYFGIMQKSCLQNNFLVTKYIMWIINTFCDSIFLYGFKRKRTSIEVNSLMIWIVGDQIESIMHKHSVILLNPESYLNFHLGVLVRKICTESYICK